MYLNVAMNLMCRTRFAYKFIFANSYRIKDSIKIDRYFLLDPANVEAFNKVLYESGFLYPAFAER